MHDASRNVSVPDVGDFSAFTSLSLDIPFEENAELSISLSSAERGIFKGKRCNILALSFAW